MELRSSDAPRRVAGSRVLNEPSAWPRPALAPWRPATGDAPGRLADVPGDRSPWPEGSVGPAELLVDEPVATPVGALLDGAAEPVGELFDEAGEPPGEEEVLAELDEPYPLAYVRWLLGEIEWSANAWMTRYALRCLQLALGVVYFWFGVLKFIPGLSPAEGLVIATSRAFFELIGFVPPDRLVIVLLAMVEVAIGLGFLLDRHRRIVLWILVAHMLSTGLPILLLPDVVWTHPPIGLTLEGQYIVKNLVLLAAAVGVGAMVHGGSPLPASRSAGSPDSTGSPDSAGSSGPAGGAGDDGSDRWDPPWPGIEDDEVGPEPTGVTPRVWIVDEDGSLMATYELDGYYGTRR